MIELKKHVGKSPVTGKEVETNQLRIIVDGHAMGFISDEDGATPLLHVYISQKELKRIDEGVRELMHPKTTKPAKQLPPPPVRQATSNGDDF